MIALNRPKGRRPAALTAARLLGAGLFAASLITAGPHAAVAEPDPADWDAVLAEAEGQTVFWHAWAGEPRINAYIAWAGAEVSERYGVSLTHVKIASTGEAVSRVVAEKAAGRDEGGAVDLIWINGENFAALKSQELLFGPWAEALPNFPLTAPDENPAVREDFTIPVEGFEAPWGKAQLTFAYDADAAPEPPRSLAALGAWAAENPGRFAYPAPPDFLGGSFLKQALLELAADPGALAAPVDEAAFGAVTAPLWAYLDALHPNLWRGGRAFPADWGAMRRLFGDGETLITFSFDPADAAAGVAAGDFPESTRTFVPAAGALGNVNFVAIPYNANAKAGAMVLANFLLSPEAQARKQDPDIWGGATVLHMPALSGADRALFDAIDLGAATLTPAELGPPAPEPHPSWTPALEAAWAERYANR